mmetsp:Transcript_1856/g.2819  ORF Transcript_1856/g.2819 Transcript_1856/m.2819 type:complete len:97 (-) Transcript_1856:52-342(-)
MIQIKMGPNVAELKSSMKELGMSQAGDKGARELDWKQRMDVLKIGRLKRYAAKARFSPIGTMDEIMFAFIDFLKEKNAPVCHCGIGRNKFQVTINK